MRSPSAQYRASATAASRTRPANLNRPTSPRINLHHRNVSIAHSPSQPLRTTTMAESKMIPFTPEAKAMAEGFLHTVPFASELHHAPVPELMEPLPPINKRGGRTVPPEGWKTVYSMVVTQGEFCASWPCCWSPACIHSLESYTGIPLGWRGRGQLSLLPHGEYWFNIQPSCA